MGKTWKYWLPALLVFAALGFVLYRLHPYAPLLLLASLLIQAPIVYLLTRNAYNSGYDQRSRARQEQFDQDGDAEAWLAGEEQESKSLTYRFLSSAAKAKNSLVRADLLLRLGRRAEAEELLVSLAAESLNKVNKERYDALMGNIKAAGTGPAAE